MYIFLCIFYHSKKKVESEKAKWEVPSTQADSSTCHKDQVTSLHTYICANATEPWGSPATKSLQPHDEGVASLSRSLSSGLKLGLYLCPLWMVPVRGQSMCFRRAWSVRGRENRKRRQSSQKMPLVPRASSQYISWLGGPPLCTHVSLAPSHQTGHITASPPTSHCPPPPSYGWLNSQIASHKSCCSPKGALFHFIWFSHFGFCPWLSA